MTDLYEPLRQRRAAIDWDAMHVRSDQQAPSPPRVGGLLSRLFTRKEKSWTPSK